MIRLKRYFKPFVWGLLLAVALLALQAVCDLNLPNYMSKIVNVGLQQGGIEVGVPDEMPEDTFTLLYAFLTPEEQTQMTAAYPEGSGSTRLLTQGLSDEAMQQAESALANGTWTMVYTLQGMQAQTGVAPAAASKTMDLTQMNQLLPMLAMLPPEAIHAAQAKTHAMDDLVRLQTAPVMTKAIYGQLGRDVDKIQRDYIWGVGLSMLLIAFVSGAATMLVSYLSSRIGAGLARNLRSAVYDKVVHFSGAEYDQFSTASLITRTTNDVTQVQMLMTMGIRFLCYSPIMAIGGVIMALSKSVSMGWIIALAVIILLGLILTIMSLVLPKFKSLQKMIDRMNLVARETLNGLMVIRAFGTQKFEKDRFDDANQDLTQVNLFINRAMTFMMPIMMLIMNGITILIIWVGAQNVANATMQVGDMMAFMQYAMQIIMSFLMISMMFIFIPRASVSAARIADVLETPPSIVDPDAPKPFNAKARGRVEFQNVAFRYGDAEENVVEDISFVAEPNQTTALIGATGSGKSTILRLIPRFFDVTQGKILVEGVDVRDVTQHDLHAIVGYIPQKSVLMSGTIASNTKYGAPDATEQTMRDAAEVAQALDFILEKPEGFDSEIAQAGSNVSGGQRQRLSIARALTVKPHVYLFDDSFSALDFKTDAALRKALKGYTKDASVLIVAQRVSTILTADLILVIDNGRIVGRGTHKTLLKDCAEYREIASSQLSEEELAQ